ncbi:MAG: PIN domain-containing protein [Terracidiphilus sp.]|jgi:predicted nucleic acid-binding protein
MTVLVLDSSAVLRYIDGEAGIDRVEAILQSALLGAAEIQLSAVQWGEIAGRLRRRAGALEEKRVLQSLLQIDFRIVPATAERAVRAAEIKEDRKLAYADAFAIELAMDSPDHFLVTADYDFKDVADLAQIEFLPLK